MTALSRVYSPRGTSMVFITLKEFLFTSKSKTRMDEPACVASQSRYVTNRIATSALLALSRKSRLYLHPY
nr:MAG TPA: hypothetical protein [Caudoviricetes sp.]